MQTLKEKKRQYWRHSSWIEHIFFTWTARLMNWPASTASRVRSMSASARSRRVLLPGGPAGRSSASAIKSPLTNDNSQSTSSWPLSLPLYEPSTRLQPQLTPTDEGDASGSTCVCGWLSSGHAGGSTQRCVTRQNIRQPMDFDGCPKLH